MVGVVGRVRRQPPPGNIKGTVPDFLVRRRYACRGDGIKTGPLQCRYFYRYATLLIRVKRLSHVISAHIALPVNRLRYAWHGAGSAQGAASRRRPLYPRAPASKIAAARSLRLIPAGFGSGRGSVPAKHGPQPASMRAAPACRERLSDFEAVSTGSFSKKSE